MGRRLFPEQDEPPLILSEPDISYPRYEEARDRVVPIEGLTSRIALENSIVRLVETGVVNRGKFFDLYGMNGPHPAEFQNILVEPANGGMRLTSTSAGYLVNLLWPIGLSNYLTANLDSPINTQSLYTYASTGGWTLGDADNGGVYFNKFPIVNLRGSEEARVVRIAKSTYRPCCNNSTFFQDCNHGSALFAVLQLGASQGLTDDELYSEALAFNSYWFPEYYVRTALFFKMVKSTDWADVNPRVALGFDYSAIGPWQENVAAAVAAIPGLVPPSGGGANCGA